MPRWLGLAPAHSRNCRAESLSQSILETSAPPNSANWNWSAQSGIQSGDASSATLARAALCACRSCPSLDATSAPGETQRLSGAETSATPDADADRDIHQSPCHSTPAVPQTAWWCHCACSRASSYRTGLFSAAALAASDLTLAFDSFHPHIAPAIALTKVDPHLCSDDWPTNRFTANVLSAVCLCFSPSWGRRVGCNGDVNR